MRTPAFYPPPAAPRGEFSSFLRNTGVWQASKSAAAAGQFAASLSRSLSRAGAAGTRHGTLADESVRRGLPHGSHLLHSRSSVLRSGVSAAPRGLLAKSPPVARSAGDKVATVAFLLIPERLSLAKDVFSPLPQSQKFQFLMTFICPQSGH